MHDLETPLPPVRRKSSLCRLAKLAATLLALYGLLCICVWILSDRLAFRPPRPQGPSGNITIPTPDGEKLNALYLPNPEARYVILYSHGNGEHLGWIRLLLNDYRDHGYEVFAWDYRGYNASTGKPNEASYKEDAEIVYRYLTQTMKIPEERILLYGRSLGSHASILLAANHKVAGLILEGAFTTGSNVFVEWNPFPFTFFDNINLIGKIQSPILFLHGKSDRLVKPWHAEKMFAAAPEPKQLYWFETGHNELPTGSGEPYWKTIGNFSETLPQTKHLMRMQL